MKKRLAALFLSILMIFTCVAVTGCSKAEFAPAMWVLEGQNGNKIYLFGSIHIADETMYPMPDYINDAYEQSEFLAVEFDIVKLQEEQENMTQQEQAEYLAQFMYTDGTKAYDHMTAEQYRTVCEFLESVGIDPSLLEYYELSMWESTLTEIFVQAAGFSEEYGVDRHFITRAHKSGKTVLDIESYEFQLDMMKELPDSVVAESIASMAEAGTVGMTVQYGHMLDIYKRGRDDLLAKMNAYDPDMFETEQERVDYEKYNKMMLTDRNIHMKDVAIQYLNDGKNVFYVVGAAHMCGDDGIIELLRKEGYTVTRVEK